MIRTIVMTKAFVPEANSSIKMTLIGSSAPIMSSRNAVPVQFFVIFLQIGTWSMSGICHRISRPVRGIAAPRRQCECCGPKPDCKTFVCHHQLRLLRNSSAKAYVGARSDPRLESSRAVVLGKLMWGQFLGSPKWLGMRRELSFIGWILV